MVQTSIAVIQCLDMTTGWLCCLSNTPTVGEPLTQLYIESWLQTAFPFQYIQPDRQVRQFSQTHILMLILILIGSITTATLQPQLHYRRWGSMFERNRGYMAVNLVSSGERRRSCKQRRPASTSTITEGGELGHPCLCAPYPSQVYISLINSGFLGPGARVCSHLISQGFIWGWFLHFNLWGGVYGALIKNHTNNYNI